MPEAYLIRGTDDHGRYRYEILDSSAFTVPELLCPDCGEVRTWGLSYPTIDVDSLDPTVTQYLNTRNRDDEISLTPHQYEHLKELLTPILGSSRPMPPLTGIGPSSGSAEGKFPDFAWPSGSVGSLFLRRSVFASMRDAGFKLTGITANLEYRRPREDPLVELEILPSLHVVESQRPEPCENCGFAGKKPQGVRLPADAWDDSIPLQRIAERPELIVASASFAAFIRERELTDVRLAPMIFE